MCILGVFLNVTENFPFILIDNRDEDATRPTEPTATVHAETGVVCARDLVSGGTWCGYNTRTGAFAVLTNVDDNPYTDNQLHTNATTSRGEIINKLLVKADSAEFYDRFLNDEKYHYGFKGFNVVCGNIPQICKGRGDVYWMTNRIFTPDQHWPQPSDPVVQKLEPGYHSVSNSYLNDFSWRKVKHLREKMVDVGEHIKNETDVVKVREQVGSLLNIRAINPDFNETLLPDHCKVHELTPWQTDNELIDVHSSNNIFVNYSGSILNWTTRSQTIIVGEKNGTVHYFYRNCDEIRNDPHSVAAQWSHQIFPAQQQQ